MLTAIDSGAAYVFTRAATVWTQQAYLKPSNTGAGDDFGAYGLALSADGNTLAVGADGEDSAATGINGDQTDNSAVDSGAVYTFKRTATTWAQQAYIKASNTGAGDVFGFTLALSADGSTLAAGAFAEDSAATGLGGNQADNSAVDSGAVYVFRDGGSGWSQDGYFKATNTDPGDLFGWVVALSADGSMLLSSAVTEDSAAVGIDGNQADNTALNSGAVYLYY